MPANESTLSSEIRESLLCSVDDAFLVVGKIVRAALYERLERTYQIKREDIPEMLEDLHSALQALLGASCPVIERLIAKNLHNHLGLNFKQVAGWTLADYVKHARTFLSHSDGGMRNG